MKINICMIVITVLIINISGICYAENYTTLPQTSTKQVGAQFSKINTDVVSVDIVWGNMNYKYKSDLVWDTSSGAYKPKDGDTGEWVLADPSNNNENAVVRIINNSNRTIYAGYSYNKSSYYGIPNTVNSSFYSDSNFSTFAFYETTSNRSIVSLAEEGTTEGENIDEYYLKLTGKLSTISSDIAISGVKVGSVTVSLNTTGGAGSND